MMSCISWDQGKIDKGGDEDAGIITFVILAVEGMLQLQN